jgi:hypothetical protein
MELNIKRLTITDILSQFEQFGVIWIGEESHLHLLQLQFVITQFVSHCDTEIKRILI